MNDHTLKEHAIRTMQALPDDADWRGLVEHLDLRLAIELGRADIRAGRFIDQDELERELEAE